MSQQLRNLCIIPARGGSKRIPRKNIRDFLGKPIISYSIEAALSSGLFAEVMVSTDDDEIAAVAKAYGAEVPFKRSIDAANDRASTMSVIEEVISEYSERGQEFDAVCCLYATAPFVEVYKLREGRNLLFSSGCDTVLPMVRFSYPIWRGLRKKSGDGIEMIWPEHLESRSQDLEPVFHDAGQWYWIRREAIGIKTFESNCIGVELSEEIVQDIDSETDWSIAEIKYEQLKRRGKF